MPRSTIRFAERVVAWAHNNLRRDMTPARMVATFKHVGVKRGRRK